MGSIEKLTHFQAGVGGISEPEISNFEGGTNRARLRKNKKLRNEPILENRMCLQTRWLDKIGAEVGWQTNPFFRGVAWLYPGLSEGKWVRCFNFGN